MKSIAIIAAGLCLAASAFGQGQINFNNRVTGTVVAPIYGPGANGLIHKSGNATTNGGAVDYTGHALLSGTGFTATLWGAPTANPTAFEIVGSTTFRTQATLPGFVNPITPFVPLTVAASQGNAVFQVRAWDNKNGTVTTWAAAMANPLVASGASDTFTALVAFPPATPGEVVGLTSFNLTVVPEPGVIALGVLGLGALLLRRRK